MPPWLYDAPEIAFALYVGVGVFLCIVCWHVLAGQRSGLGRARAALFFVPFWGPYLLWTVVCWLVGDYFLPGD